MFLTFLMKLNFFLIFVIIFFVESYVDQSLQYLPLSYGTDFVYEGAFRLPASTFGSSNLNYAEGTFTLSNGGNSIFIIGHSHDCHVAEFSIPEILDTDLVDLNMADNLQEFSTTYERAPSGNPESLQRIGGLHHFSNGKLLINAFEYYDAPGDNQMSTMFFDDALELSSTTANGFFKPNNVANPAHLSGWIEEVPDEWKSEVGGSHLMGFSSGWPIIGRLSVGPSLFSFDPDPAFWSNSGDTFDVKTLLDYRLGDGTQLHGDLSNDLRTNHIWTHLTRAAYGFIIPGTKTYAVFGKSGGHYQGVCYKCTQWDSNLCGGYCSPDPNDYYLYYWFYNMDDLINVKEGNIESHIPRPYDYGRFPAAKEWYTHSIGGGSYDFDKGILYLSILTADREQGTYSNPPVIVAYKVVLGYGQVTWVQVVVGSLIGSGAFLMFMTLLILVAVGLIIFGFVIKGKGTHSNVSEMKEEKKDQVQKVNEDEKSEV